MRISSALRTTTLAAFPTTTLLFLDATISGSFRSTFVELLETLLLTLCDMQQRDRGKWIAVKRGRSKFGHK